MSTTPNPYRLDRTVVPNAYRIFLTPDLESATFAGRVEIDVDVVTPGPSFTLHAIELELGAASLSGAGTTLSLSRARPGPEVRDGDVRL